METSSAGLPEADQLPFVPSPGRTRPSVPEGYGLPETDEGLLDWAQVEQRLVAATHYWLATVRANGAPHVVPRWGVWLAGRFWYDGAPTTRHARNLEANPHCSLNLESGAEVVIVEGTSVAVRAAAEGFGARLAEAFAKYDAAGYRPEADSWSGPEGGGLRVMTPARALAWFSFPTDMTRFIF